MIQALVRLILGMYPPWWRRKYGAETADLTEQLLADRGTHRWRVLASLLSGSLLAWLQLRRIGDYLQPLSSPNAWGMIPRGSHRDIFGNRGLWPRSEAELEPGEALLGVLDGVVGIRYIANMPMFGVTLLVTYLILAWPLHLAIWGYVVGSAFYLILGLLLRPLTKSYLVSVAVTSHGVVVFRRAITGRTGRVVQRMPAVEPELVRYGSMNRKVRLGDRTFWLGRRSDPMLYWMSQTLRAARGR